MNHLFYFTELFEKLQMVTSNWSIVSNESSFDKKEGNGYLIFSTNGTFSIAYKKKEGKEESRIEFYGSKENSSDKKSVCECKIIDNLGKDRVKKSFPDITVENVWDIVSIFFDYSDVEKMEKSSVDEFLMGLCKSIKEVNKVSERDQLSPSFKVFYKYIEDWSKKYKEDPKISPEKYEFMDIVKKFISYFKSNK